MPPQERRQGGVGTGFIIDKSGYIFFIITTTTNHVVENADSIKVKLKDKREFAAKIVGRDSQTDVVPGNPAEKAGIKAKGIITAVNGEKVKSSRELTAKAATLTVDEITKITVVRDGRPEAAARQAQGRRRGLVARSTHQYRHDGPQDGLTPRTEK